MLRMSASAAATRICEFRVKLVHCIHLDLFRCNGQGWFNQAACVGVSRAALGLLLLSAILNN